mmetsp:Transcript_1146/g.2484  ORF Transcript_1146/g.2484 Transcript_1146/m.2484 type:complete len:242 (+) Transcript_1146:247-972(+)|eukprot:CAMPEP_0173385336 /NCGR_PEP_ID=MMETSP1356-20130122/7930_1 /TAXON_ID=77927 ORGANISM="Hemiselmis virescens, Strain PCC157" /NCGR_SAMPLE_ID=MMETSP1356 /ASSEMBLY_ACC=CAM_ASM_000847 /LENGTH=241 /DNA_ID=CAMNT_0014341081 /DNA_START=211 /DNA_END=936 /DNA_ORIENTATION=-
MEGQQKRDAFGRETFDLDMGSLQPQNRGLKIMEELDGHPHDGESGGVKAELVGVDDGKHGDDDGDVQDGAPGGSKAKRKRQKKMHGLTPGGFLQSAPAPYLVNPVGSVGVVHPSSGMGMASHRMMSVTSLPSVVTWWQYGMCMKVRKKQRHDTRVNNPGKGSRGSDKRVPRQLTFKLQVIEHYQNNLRLKQEGKLDDPCLATARHFQINKSQVSKWFTKKDAIQDKVSSSGGISDKKRSRC